MPVIKKAEYVSLLTRAKQELVERRLVGSQMSNVLYNLCHTSQKEYFPPREVELFEELLKKWDLIVQEKGL